MENMEISKLWFGALGVALVLALGGCGAQGSGPSLATVGDGEITVAEFEFAALDHPLIHGDRSPEAKSVLLGDLIDRELLIQEAMRLGYTDSPGYESAMKTIRSQTLNEELYRALVSNRVRVSEAEIAALYDGRDTEWRLSQIFAFSRTESDVVRRRLEAGETFEEVASSSSVEPGTMTQGGDIGYVTAGEMPGKIEKLVRGLEVGEWGGPVFSGTGYYFIKISEVRPRERQAFEEIEDQLVQILRLRKERALVLDFVQRLKARNKLQRVNSSFDVLARYWQNRTADELLASGGDLHALGFSDEDLMLPLVEYQGGSYTIQDLFTDLFDSPTMDRPPSTSDPLLRLYVEDRVVERLLIESADRKGVAERPEAAQRIEAERGSYLINEIYERVVVPAATVSDEEMESLRGAGPGGLSERSLNERAVQLFEQKRQNVLSDLLLRLRSQTPPVIHEDVLARVPWPVAPRENA
jgi:peptidyl-prolyl cis-trans isomerase C